MYVLGLLGVFFIGIYVATGMVSGRMTGVLVPIVHIFVFGAVAQMWAFICAWHFTDYQKYSTVFWGLGVLSILAGLGIFAGVVPAVAGQIIPLSLIPVGLLIGGMGWYTAYQIGGADGQKIAIFTAGAFDALLISALLNNLYLAGVIPSPYPPIVNNLLYGGLFLLAVFWGQIKGVQW
ncbi:MAG: hypothetical protein SVU32_00945 [Candidatus Nanohaloarchaea archaeon]|nr:hypothetical protein [Candidatus Nanohaloarchaea archaeon]